VQVHVKGSLACQSPGYGSWPYSLHGAGAAAPWEETTLARSLLEVRLPLRTRSTLCRMRGFSCAAMTITRARTSMGLPQRKPRRGRVWPRATRLDQQSAGQVEERASNCATSSMPKERNIPFVQQRLQQGTVTTQMANSRISRLLRIWLLPRSQECWESSAELLEYVPARNCLLLTLGFGLEGRSPPTFREDWRTQVASALHAARDIARQPCHNESHNSPDSKHEGQWQHPQYERQKPRHHQGPHMAESHKH
jgi:hypothetical protein